MIVMMRTAETYLKEEMNIEMPQGEINGKWFADKGLPMIVECACCGMTMALPSAMIDEEGRIFCSQCAEE
jgi:formylmethanofuran dehydrogenase subunit E